MPEIEREGGRIHWRADGPPNAPALLCSNSLGSDLELWRPQLGALGACRIIRYDTRGHGRSSATPGPYDLDLLGNDAVAVLDAAGAKRADFLGISLGGLTGMWLGINAPERVRKLVLANTGAKIGTTETWNQRIEAVRAQGLAAIADSVLARWFTPGFSASGAGILAQIRATFVATSPEGYIACCEALRDADLREEIAAIHTPVLVLTGAGDLSTPAALRELVRDRIAGAHLISLPAAHISNVEQPDAFNRAVLDFLSA
jgi:3-oxoadipate enol-lactonase/4-carboxymuconolactone decarboxylase